MSYEVEQKWSQISYLKGLEFPSKAENCWSLIVILQTLRFFEPCIVIYLCNNQQNTHFLH
jgi:hypothetical protein